MALPDNLVFVRHGYSEANFMQKVEKAKDKEFLALHSDNFYARHNSEARLTEIGVAQAQAAGEWLRKENMIFDKFYASPYLRTRETAAHLGLGGPWGLEDLIRERDWGEFGASSEEERHQMFATNMKLKDQNPWYWRPAGGESMATGVRARVNSFISRMEGLTEGYNVVAVTHGEFMRTVQFVLERMTPDEWVALYHDDEKKINNCTILQYSRVNPDTGERYHRYKWVRQINTVNPEASPYAGAWREFSTSVNSFPKYTDEELLASLELTPRLFAPEEVKLIQD